VSPDIDTLAARLAAAEDRAERAERRVERLGKHCKQLREAVLDHENDCAVLPEDWSVTEYVGRVRAERDALLIRADEAGRRADAALAAVAKLRGVCEQIVSSAKGCAEYPHDSSANDIAAQYEGFAEELEDALAATATLGTARVEAALRLAEAADDCSLMLTASSVSREADAAHHRWQAALAAYRAAKERSDA
jgi:hypothetical protein